METNDKLDWNNALDVINSIPDETWAKFLSGYVNAMAHGTVEHYMEHIDGFWNDKITTYVLHAIVGGE
jgi:hypothetical protein